MTTQPRYYVYILTHTDGTPFYVGIGTKHRIYRHAEEARRGHQCPKCDIIRAIWQEGTDFHRTIVLRTDDEQIAHAEEARLIAHYGREMLVNHTDGGKGIRGRQQPRPVTFICQWCEREVTEERMPGSPPRYCRGCRDEARRANNVTRVQRYRSRHPDETPQWQRKPRGRPRKY